ncbi:hypothetical protein PN36_09150 [Candidatus Thiomargarita nelsonii]|uniref:Uncharacterized protein n=1 Tax=Candidatus Thiomargarita nelsonii TaxID=1003181 RepID=A0A0A6PLR9_9GAMM|nr:hypothetical protein PN36_09150 [Candidatus Thiomargarita nelsonii]
MMVSFFYCNIILKFIYYVKFMSILIQTIKSHKIHLKQTMNIITTSNQIEKFLFEFQNIAKVNGVRFWQRPENLSMMTMLDLTESVVTKDILLNLTAKDYCEGPIPEESHSDAWCFGQNIDGKNVYIKLTITKKKKRKRAECISFHEPTRPLFYPYA